MIGRQRIPPTKSYFSRMAQTPCRATVHILVAALTHWRYGLTSQPAFATLVPSASVRGWLVSLACAEYLGRAGQLSRPDSPSRRYPPGVSTPSAGTSCVRPANRCPTPPTASTPQSGTCGLASSQGPVIPAGSTPQTIALRVHCQSRGDDQIGLLQRFGR